MADYPKDIILSRLEDHCVAVVGGLGIIIPNYDPENPYDSGGSLIQVVKGVATRRAEGLDPPNQITVAAQDSPDQIQYAAFGVTTWVKYLIVITVIQGNDQDLDGSQIPPAAKIRERIRQRFTQKWYTPMLGILGVWDVRVRPYTFFNRGMLASNYNFQALGVEFTTNG